MTGFPFILELLGHFNIYIWKALGSFAVEKLCTEIAIIRKGQIVYQSSMEEIEKNHPEGLESFYLSMIHDNGDLDD